MMRIRSRSAAVLAVGLVVAACSPQPEPLALGDTCALCHMSVADLRFGAERITRRGHILKYDAIECMVRDVLEAAADGGDDRSLWVVPFDSPGTLVPIEEARFYRSETIRSPMGMGLLALSPGADAAASGVSESERLADWAAVVEYVREAGEHGSIHGHQPEPRTSAIDSSPVRPGDAASLAAVVREAPEGSVVIVPAGVYAGPTIEIDRALRIEGQPGAILDGRGDTPLLVIRAPGVTVRGLVFRNVAQSHVEDRAALRVVDTADCIIEDNAFENTYFAIYIENSERCRIERNRIEGSAERETAAGNGIHLWYSRSIDIANNTIRGHRDGIYFEFVEDSRVENNDSHANLRYGLHFMFSDRCSYMGNRFVGNGAGVAVMYTRQVEMRDNVFADNRGTATYGLLLKDISDAVLSENRFLDNTVAVYMEGTTRVDVQDSEFHRNGWAIRLSSNIVAHRFTGNTFTGNTFDMATNGRRLDAVVEGNYWDAYAGYDLDGDGVGDVPFRPVRLLSWLVERHPPMLALVRGLFVQMLDAAERVLPVFTPEALIDERPRMNARVAHTS